MERKNLSQILKDAKIDYRREYDRLYQIFYELGTGQGDDVLRDACASAFWNMPMRGTCLSLDDFDEVYGINFEKDPEDFDLNYLLSFCEYTYNLVIYTSFNWGWGYQTPSGVFQNQLGRVIELIGYMFSQTDDGIYILVPKDQAVISVSEILDKNLSYKVIEYNHNSMKGNLEKKKGILIALADKLEPSRKKLKQINSTLEDQLFFMLNNLNIRHNNTEQGSKEYKKYVADMEQETLEKWYDETYQMCLLAFLELDNVERKSKIEKLKKDVAECQ